jgi:hypothetical protein
MWRRASPFIDHINHEEIAGPWAKWVNAHDSEITVELQPQVLESVFLISLPQRMNIPN